MKKNKFKDNKYKCDYCNTLNFITVYLVKDKCPICNKKLTLDIKIKMKLQLIKGFVKKRDYLEYRKRRNEQIALNQPTKKR